MSEILFQPMPQTEPEYEEALAQIFAEMQRLNEQMRHDQEDIDRLNAESAAYKMEMQRLQAEGKLLEAEARTRLDNIRVALDRLQGAA